jgi:serine/threonine-protein kinase
MSTFAPASPAGDRSLLFGALAVQTALLSRQDLAATLEQWQRAPAQTLGALAVERGLLDADECRLLDGLVQRLLDRHGGDARQCLDSVGARHLLPQPLPTTQDAVRGDSAAPVSTTDSAQTPVAPSLGAVTDSDPGLIPPPPQPRPPQARSRYRVLRPHARGGLGVVSVAQDEELQREVALKEIQERHAGHPESRLRFLLEAEVTGGLEHPGIVPVYGLGAYPDGRLFYAMRLIRGHGLDAAIRDFHKADRPGRDAGERALALRELLGRFVAVCNAVAYAHSRGVLHRDLKPANIMLGAYGETLVVDWGLARLADRPEAGAVGAEAPLRPRSSGARMTTLAGRVLGTPQYMSPEQAAGRPDEMGPASDVYSLGATLYQLLTGAPPLPAEDLDSTLRKVERGQFPQPRQVKRSVPAPLEAVCLKAMALRPQDRYASAQELAREIERWLADEPLTAYREPAPARLGRWARRHRTLVAGTAALLLTAAVGLGIGLWAVGREQRRTAEQRDRAEESLRALAVEQERTARQRDLAEENLRLARQAVDECFLLARDHPLLQRASLSPVRRLLLSRALPFYERFQVHHPDDPGVREELATNYNRVGYITSQIGREADALEAFTRARDAWARLAGDHPAVLKYQAELARCWHNVGILHLDGRRSVQARAAFEQARTILQDVLAKEPQVEDYWVYWAKVHTSLGNLGRATGKLDEALAADQKAQDVWDRLVRQHPENASYRSDQASTCFNRANLLARKAQWVKAEAAFRQAQQWQQQLADKEPDVPQHRADLARTCTNLGNLFRITNRLDDALASYQKSRELGERLVLEQPEVTQYRAELIKACINCGVVFGMRGQWGQAVAVYRQVQQSQQRLVQEHADVPEYRGDLAMTLTNLGSLHRKLARPADALDAYRQADAAWEQLVGKHPDILEHKMHAAALKGNVGALLLETGKAADSLAWLDRALQLLVEVRGREPNNRSARQFQVNALCSRADALSRLGRTADALRDWDTALELDAGVLARSGRVLTQMRAAYSRSLAGEAAKLAATSELPGEALYTLAAALSVAAGAVRTDTHTPPAERESLARQYAAAAVAQLTRARTAGWFNNPAAIRQLREDADFAPVREQASFRKIVADLEKNSSAP